MKRELREMADYIKERIATNRVWTERALIALYEQQTMDEQVAAPAHTENGRGCDQADAGKCSDLGWSNLSRGQESAKPSRFAAHNAEMTPFSAQSEACKSSNAPKWSLHTPSLNP